MKQLTIKLIIPLTIISFAIITKWWYALPVDAPDTMFSGFPFPFVCQGWHTSLSLQIFMTELIIDLLTYFTFWFILVFCSNRFLTKINSHKIVTIVLWTLTGIVISFSGLSLINPDNLFFLKRPFAIEIMDTGYTFIWQDTIHPDYYKYHPKDKKE